MSLFRSTSFRLKKRDKAHRPPPLEGMLEKQEHEATGSLQSLDTPVSSYLAVPDSARSTLFALSSGMSSRTSLFSRTSTSSQDDKHRSSFFKLPNLSRGSFVLRREREERKWDPFDSTDDTVGPFTRISHDLNGSGYIPKSKRPESASASMSNLLAGLDVIDICAPPVNPNVRQRSRTLSTRSDPDLPDLPLRAFTNPPSLNPCPSTDCSSLETPSSVRTRASVLPRLSLDTAGSRVSPIQLPSLSGLSPTSVSLSPIDLDESLSPTLDEPTIVVKRGLLSPAPTIVSATSTSTIQDSLMSSHDTSSSESDPDLNSTRGEGEDECGPIEMFDSSICDDSELDYYHQFCNSPINYTHPRLTLTPSGRASPLESPRQPGSTHIGFSGPPAVSDASRSSFMDPFESYFSPDAFDESPGQLFPCEPSSSKLKPTLDVPGTPVHKLASNAFRAGNTPPPRKPRTRKAEESVTTISNSHSKFDESKSSLVPPDEPSTPSFLVGLAWPRPPLRQIYVDVRKSGASWHAVSRTIDERLIDGSGIVNTDPCHVIMFAQTGAETTAGVSETLERPEMGSGRRRGGVAMWEQQPLSPAAVSALSTFAVRSRSIVCS